MANKNSIKFCKCKKCKGKDVQLVNSTTEKNKNNRFVFGIFIEIIQQYQCFYNDHQK